VIIIPETKINSVTCASCWDLYIAILLQCTDPCILNLCSTYFLQHKPWFDEECLVILDQRKQAKTQWMQDPSQSNVDNLNNVRRDASRHFRNKKKGRMRWAGHVARMGEDRGVYTVLVGKPGGKRPLGRPRRRWEDNIKMDLQEFGGFRRDWMELAQDRDRWRALVGTVRNFQVP
jgi:hypothetical protein